MISLKFDSRKFQKDMNNLVGYSLGFADGIQNGKTEFLRNLAPSISEIASEFIDVNARVSPETLHHVYEWHKTGSPDARLFDIHFTINRNGISFNPEFSQSSSIQRGSTVPFYNKAYIMENGISVTIEPRNAEALAFDVNGEMIFSKGPIVIENPGGIAAQGGFEKAFEMFFGRYFTQAFLRTSGLAKHFNNPISYKTNLKRGMNNGRNVGLSTGYRWVANVKVAR